MTQGARHAISLARDRPIQRTAAIPLRVLEGGGSGYAADTYEQSGWLLEAVWVRRDSRSTETRG